MRVLLLLLLLSVPGLGQETGTAAPTATARSEERGFLSREVTVGEKTFRYVVYVPVSYDKSKPIPLVLFLHGSGERGSDGLLQTDVGVGRAIRRNPKRVPGIVVFPQCEAKEMWTGVQLDMAVACVEKTMREYNIDRRRFYLTGLSMGGAGVWELASRMPERVAAIAPICGYVVDSWRELPGEDNVERTAEAVKTIPAWIFHGLEDRAVMVEHSQMMAGALKKRKAPVTYTEYPEGKHNIWDRVYEQREFWAWLFTQKLPEAP